MSIAPRQRCAPFCDKYLISIHFCESCSSVGMGGIGDFALTFDNTSLQNRAYQSGRMPNSAGEVRMPKVEGRSQMLLLECEVSQTRAPRGRAHRRLGARGVGAGHAGTDGRGGTRSIRVDGCRSLGGVAVPPPARDRRRRPRAAPGVFPRRAALHRRC